MIVMELEIDQNLCDKVTAALAPLGLTLADAIVLFFKKTAELGRIPFSYTQEELETAKQSNSIRLVSEYIDDDLQISSHP